MGSARRTRGAGSAIDELTRVLPDDVVYFVATGGGTALEDDFRKSVLGRLWNDPGMQTFVGSIRKELTTLLDEQAEHGEAIPMTAMGLEYAPLVLDRPLVVGVAEVDAEEGPPACIFAILDAGERKSELAAALTRIEGMIGEGNIVPIEVGSLQMHSLKDADDVPVYWGWAGEHLVLAVNDAGGKVVRRVVAPRATPTDHLQKVPDEGDLLAVYYDFPKVWGTLEALAAREGDEEGLATAKKVVRELGLLDLGTVTARIGFSGPSLASHSFVEAPTPRRGLLAAFEPVELAWFGSVDPQAVSAGAFNCDVTSLYDHVMDAIKAASPEDAYPDVQKGLADLESEIGFKLREDLLKSLAGPVVYYSLPAGKMVEAPMGGVVVALKLSDPALFEKTMTTIGTFVAKASEEMLQVGTQVIDGRTLHVWASPLLSFAQVMPTWSVVGDQVIIGSNAALCKNGLELAASGDMEADSLLKTERFQAMAGRLPRDLLSLTYTDSQVMFNQMMMQVQQIWPMATMAAREAGVKLPVVLPSLGHIARDMQPAWEYSYSGADGFYSHYKGSGLEMSLRGVAGGGVAAGFIMPRLSGARQQARRAASMSNLRQLGLAVIMYADDHDGRLPATLEEARTYYGDDQVLQSPRRPERFDGPSYIYVPGHSMETDRPSQEVVIYENPALCDDRIPVLFLDGHVEAMAMGAFREKLKATCERLGREMPEIEFED